MKKIFFLIILLVNCYNLFSQNKYNLLYLTNYNNIVSKKKDNPLVFNDKKFLKEIKSYNKPQKCKPGMILLLAPIVGIGTSFASYTSFRGGFNAEGYVMAGISAFLIVVPVSYIIYCNKHDWN